MTKKPYTAPGALRWLPLVLVVILGAAAWGQQQQKSTAQEQKDAAQEERIQQNEAAIRTLETGQATILERTKNIIDNQKAYQETSTATMKEVLLELRRR